MEKLCIKRFCESLKERAMKITDLKKKKMKLSTKEQQESYQNAKVYYITKEKYENKDLKDEIIVKLEIIVIIQGNIEVLGMVYVT